MGTAFHHCVHRRAPRISDEAASDPLPAPEPDMGSISFQEGVVAIHDTSPVLAEPAVPLTSDG